MVLYYNAAKSRIYNTGVLVEPHNRQIYDTGVLVEWRQNVTKSLVLLGDSRVAGPGRAGPGRVGSGRVVYRFSTINSKHASRATTSSSRRRKRALKNRRPEEHA